MQFKKKKNLILAHAERNQKNMDEFSRLHLELLGIEREAELSQAMAEAKAMPREARLMCDSVSTGARTTVILRRRAALPLQLGRISVGDVVCIRPVSEGGTLAAASNAPPTAASLAKWPRGVVSRLTDMAVTVTIDDEGTAASGGDEGIDIDAQQMSSVYLVRLANDVTYERLCEALRALPKLAERRVAQVAFGIAEPRFLAELGAVAVPPATATTTMTTASSSAAASVTSSSSPASPLIIFDKGLNQSQIDAVEFAFVRNALVFIARICVIKRCLSYDE